MKNTRLIEDSDRSLLDSLSASAFSPAVSNGQWKMEGSHVATLTLRLPPIKLFQLPSSADLKKALNQAGLVYKIPEGVDHRRMFSVMRLKVFEIDPQRFEQNKAGLQASLVQYGEAIASETQKKVHRNIINLENKPKEFFER